MTEKKKIYSDEELIARFQKGDERAYIELVRRYKDRLLNFVYRYLNSYEQAEDVVQDTLLKLYTSAHMYREIARFSTWIFTIAANLAKSELRRIKRRRVVSIHDMGFDDKEYEIPSEAYSPEKETTSSYGEKQIQQAINTLPDQFKTVIILREVQQLSYEEISQILGISIGTVKSRINRGRLRLQKLLKELKTH
ncbi:MAG: sigma-70 family RNA polymerase sigma factor [Candidatus Neomarinimicrobiota bacterium]|jgi:RNA polymerase sigma-70 factor (ECF subfamily)|nr:sigma-70 family RNA polymerase sigma factor [Candidatus Neomarinimicrobiota bacterium]MDD3966438.1 sigma-70 family RNA polymerase sigma factor [Candidatus Neomarinimicrobiota bacterium]MDX9780834.1 sigma-70 family RNA polymerase sigma factor [bacterium]